MNIAIANMTIICAWDLIEKNLKRYNTNFIPVDSEHFSIFQHLTNLKIKSSAKNLFNCLWRSTFRRII